MSSKTSNPFKGIKLTPEKKHNEVVFEVAAGISVRATYNLSPHVGRLSRGVIGIWDTTTGRFKQRIQDGTHNFRNSLTEELLIPAPKNGETQAEIIERTTRKAANKLLSDFGPLILASIHENKDLGNYSLRQALELYSSDYIADSSVSSEMRKTYYNQLQKLSNFLGEKPLNAIKRKDFVQFCKINKSENSTNYISNFQKFLDYTAFRLGIKSPCQHAFDSFFRDHQKKKKKTKTESSIIADVLPNESEDKLDRGCWDHLGDPFWGITVAGKEGGLNVDSLCALRIKSILLGDTAEEAYVIHKRDDLASYTRDYSFALSPFGASYITEYIAFLKDNNPPERMEEDKYLFSKDKFGDIPLTTKEVNSFIRNELSRFLFGYVGRVPLTNGTTISLSLDLLRNTRKKHMLEACRFDDDRSAILFLLHQSLTRFVQADNYRSFTDIYGRRLLHKRLAQDRHGCRPPSTPKEYKRMSQVIRGGNRELRFPSKHNSCPGRDQLITITVTGLNPGDTIEVVGQEGCYVWFDQ